MSLQQQEQFYQMMTRLRRLRAASSSVPKEDAIVTEIVNGLIVSKPAKKIEYLSTKEDKATTTNESQAKVWNLTKDGPVLAQQQESKAASVPGIQKMKAIHDFIRSNGRI